MLEYAKATLVAMATISLVSGCSKEDAPVLNQEVPIVCRLDALTEAEREREGDLLQEHVAAVQEIRERDDGYSFRYAADH